MPFFGVPIRNGLPIGLGSVAGFGVQQFDPSLLFEGGTVPGAWYDPSDLSTMFTTDAGTTPVAMPGGGTAVSVGRILDKSGNGNHAVSIAPGLSTSRPVLSARVNLLTYSEEFDNGVWTKFGLNAFGSGSVANTTATLDPLGGNTADYIQEDTASSTHSAYWTLTSAVSSATYTYSIYVKSAGQNRWLRFNVGNNTNSWFNPDTGLWGTVAAGYTAGTPENVGNGWWRVSLTGVAGASTVYLTVGLATGNNNTTYLGIGSAGLYFWGADLRPANIGANIPAYQRIADANTYDTNGFPLYLRFDGIDDGMYTPANLNLGANKVSVFAGVRKLTNALGQMVCELSTLGIGSVANSFGLLADVAGPNAFGFGSRGATGLGYAYPASSTPAPITNIATGLGDTVNNTAVLRLNGAQDSSSGTTQGGGNYGTYPLYIGSRANSSLWFNGHLHGLIIAGSAVSAGNISATENWMAGKTGLVLP